MPMTLMHGSPRHRIFQTGLFHSYILICPLRHTSWSGSEHDLGASVSLDQC